MRLNRKATMFTGIAAAALVGLSSVAFACLTTKGKIDLKTTNGAGDTVKSDGRAVSHGFCYNPTIAASTAASGGTVMVSVAPNGCGSTPSNQLANGNARVVLQHDNGKPGWTRSGAGVAWSFVSGNGCFAGGGVVTKTLATTFNVSSGSASATFNIPAFVGASDANEAGHICVRDSAGTGAFAPLVLT